MEADYYAELAKQLVAQYPNWVALLTFVLAFGESIAFVSLFLPFWIMLVTVGSLVGGPASWNFWLVVIAAGAGAALGDWVSYWLGYHYHERIQSMWPLSKYPTLIENGKLFFRRWGTWAIVLARFTGPLRASVPIVAGIAQMPMMLFQVANWTSAFLWSGVLVYFGGVSLDVLLYLWRVCKDWFMRAMQWLGWA
jgi:membrane protein DedA with SNARE-associated domain